VTAKKKTTKKKAPPRARVSGGLSDRIGVRLRPAEREAITELAIKKNINDGDLVREALNALPGFAARVKRIEANAR